MKDKAREEFLARLALFSDLTEEERELVASLLHERRYKKGEVIVSEGEEGTSLFLFKKGVVQVSSQITLRRAGDEWLEAEKSIVTYDETKMPFFGEMSLLTGSPRSATVKAMTDVELYEIFQKDFYALCDQYHTVGYKLLRAIAGVLCNRIRVLNQNILKLTTALSIVVSKRK